MFRLLSFVPLPGIDPHSLQSLFSRTQGGVIDFFNNFSGGALSRHVGDRAGRDAIHHRVDRHPARQSSLSPTLAAIKKEGESGRKKLNQYTRYGTVLLTAVQGYFIAVGLEGWGAKEGLTAVVEPGMLFRDVVR